MPTVRYVIAWYVVMSVITLGTYGFDKWRAGRGSKRPVRRVSERTLHGLELCGGWPGALVGQQLFKHKRAKAPYMRVFWAIVGCHVAGWVWWLVSGW